VVVHTRRTLIDGQNDIHQVGEGTRQMGVGDLIARLPSLWDADDKAAPAEAREMV
jgi:hypothetical protein